MTPQGRILTGCCLAGLLVFTRRPPGVWAAEADGVARFHQDIQPILSEYCYDCHADGANKGGVAFDTFKADNDILNNHDLWWNALNYVRSGLMPPGKKARPSAAEQQRLTDWIKTSVFKYDPKNPDPGRVTLRRLNRVEYRNTIRDLMGVDFDTDTEFPADDTGYGFDDIGDVLTVSPMLLEKYITAAKDIVTQAVPTDEKTIPETDIPGSRFRPVGAGMVGAGPNDNQRRPGQGQGRGGVGTSLSLPYSKPAVVGTTFDLSHEGSYQLMLQLEVKGAFDFDPRKCHVVFKLDDQELVNKEYGWYGDKTFPFQFDEKLAAGSHHLTCEVQPVNPNAPGTNTLAMRIVSVNIHGPMEKQYWARPKNFDRFFTKAAPDRAAERDEYAAELLRAFAAKAFRRPVDDKTVERLTALAKAVYIEPGKTFEAGIGQAMVAVLASPRFLFRVEESAPGASPAAAWSPVDEYSLAARLSYFLWSTLPDDELTRLAAHRELRKNLPAQVRRMLADPRSEALVRNFTGQWLQTRDLGGVAIDVRAILARDNGTEKQLHEQAAGFLARQNAAQPPPGARPPPFARDVNPPKSLDQPTRQAMKSEAEMFFASILHEDRSIDDLIDGHYTYLNEKLAAFYGLTNLGLTGDEMRRVDLPAGCVRGGVLTEGAVLVITSNPDRTSPVKRGVFVLNNILGTPPPPPPPNVPALEAAEQSGTNQEATLRVALEMHRNTPLCASCHARFDPIGLGLENFNAMGRWRDQERNQPIDPSGTLITGETFTDVRELKHILLTGHREDFYRCLTSKLLTYSLGRGLEYYDVGTVDQIVHHLEENQGRFSALLTGIIDSAPFQERRNHANAVYADSVETPAHNDAPQIATTKTAP